MRQTWLQKFAVAFRGLWIAVRYDPGFLVHAVAAAAAIGVAAGLRFTVTEWCIVLLCITFVVASELFNSALEFMAKAVTRETNPHIRDALDVASGAVLVAAIGAAVVGLLLVVHRAGQMLAWW